MDNGLGLMEATPFIDDHNRLQFRCVLLQRKWALTSLATVILLSEVA